MGSSNWVEICKKFFLMLEDTLSTVSFTNLITIGMEHRTDE